MAFAFDAWSAHDEFVEIIWCASSDRAGTFTSVAASNWELVIMRVNDQTMITVRGPETRATKADFPAGATWIGITFKLGAFMPRLPLRALLDRHDLTLPPESSNSFWLHGARWEIPTFENADVFVNRLIRGGMLVRDPAVEAALQGHTPALSMRTLQYRFIQATGLSHKTIQQIERARRAVGLLEQGTPIADTTFDLGYFDQAHLTNALKRFAGKTPAHIAQQRTVG